MICSLFTTKNRMSIWVGSKGLWVPNCQKWDCKLELFGNISLTFFAVNLHFTYNKFSRQLHESLKTKKRTFGSEMCWICWSLGVIRRSNKDLAQTGSWSQISFLQNKFTIIKNLLKIAINLGIMFVDPDSIIKINQIYI